MKIIISPAKSLDFKTALPTSKFTESSFLAQSKKINALLKEQSPKQLSDLMSISEKLANLNYTRNQDWQLPFTPENARPAVYAFNGDVYAGLDAYSIPAAKIDVLQDKLRILSGLYGLLKPLDLIQPYRLEMGTKFPVGSSKNLYDFWRKSLTEALNKEMSSEGILVNLASKEYADAIDFKAIKATIVVPEFKDYKDGKLKIISFYAKKARGQMVRYIIDNNCESIEDLKGFDYDKYRLDQNLSKGNSLVFTR
ncbi:MAG TPA: peroxide stress protein YaaA [Flavobacterium sp.]|nr:peroxide stress protein YaaA [Flavobacterium sp.]